MQLLAVGPSTVAFRGVQSELEDLCFAVLQPAEYRALRQGLDALWGLSSLPDEALEAAAADLAPGPSSDPAPGPALRPSLAGGERSASAEFARSSASSSPSSLSASSPSFSSAAGRVAAGCGPSSATAGADPVQMGSELSAAPWAVAGVAVRASGGAAGGRAGGAGPGGSACDLQEVSGAPAAGCCA